MTVVADGNQSNSSNSGVVTQDKVFLLSIPEVNKYFTSDNARKCEVTAYAKKQGADTNSSGFCWWWLRSLGSDQHYAAYVNSDGGVNGSGDIVNYFIDAVRPVLWITLDQ